MTATNSIEACTCCGSKDLIFQRVLWDGLVQSWRISEYEREYIDRQQGLACRACGSNLRSMALALAICRCYRYTDTLARFVKERSNKGLRILEVNEAGGLTQFLSQLPKHCIGRYPELDMMRMPFADGSFDLVVHSDTLEHVPHPITALTECWRVLALGGFCAFTVPMIVERMTVGRAGLPLSYHGTEEQHAADLVVHTEYGCDSWKHLVLAGFVECRVIALEFPAALALVGVH
jgi:SAM-dependent methyltransferase